jgi:hypothetical protein
MMQQTMIQGDLAAFLEDHTSPCLSLYQPTHRRHPENAQDPIRYKNLLKVLEESLLGQHSTKNANALLDPFRKLATDRDFWNHTCAGLAVLGTAGLFRVFKLQRPVPELAVVADSFHIKPLLRILQSADRYQVLSVNRREIKLFEGNRDNLNEVDLDPRIPRTITEALGEELTEPHHSVGSFGMRHGHGSRADEIDVDEQRFFRVVDRAILEYDSRASGMPLILAALRQYHTPFRQVSHNPLLMPNGIEVDANSLTIDQLRQRAWAIVEPEFRSRLAKLTGEIEEAKAKGLGSDDLAVVAQAAVQSRVGSLLVEAERRIPGHVDSTTGRITFGNAEDVQVDDLLDDVAELVLRKGGSVVVVPAADMPSETGVAAAFRF